MCGNTEPTHQTNEKKIRNMTDILNIKIRHVPHKRNNWVTWYCAIVPTERAIVLRYKVTLLNYFLKAFIQSTIPENKDAPTQTLRHSFSNRAFVFFYFL